MGRVIIFPTDTVYGIATSIYDLDGIKKIYDIKKRDKNKQLACLCANVEQIESIAYIDDLSRTLINKYLPGALTIILRCKEEIVKKLGYETIGVRIPNNKITITILEENGPMLTTSVNESGNIPLNEYTEIVKNYNKVVDYIYKTDENSSNISSTVVSCLNGKIEILREGEIKIDV